MIHITIGSGKLAGINSINTSTLENDFCSKMRKTDSVCRKCYAARYESFRTTLETRLIQNSAILSEKTLNRDVLPYINASVFRFSSFGELINRNHLLNLLAIAEKNPHCNFTLWTKRKDLICNVLRETKKPENLILIYSSPKIGQIAKKPMFFDKVFTVFAKSEKGNAAINCHGSCASCLLCYTKNNTVQINEVVK